MLTGFHHGGAETRRERKKEFSGESAMSFFQGLIIFPNKVLMSSPCLRVSVVSPDLLPAAPRYVLRGTVVR